MVIKNQHSWGWGRELMELIEDKAELNSSYSTTEHITRVDPDPQRGDTAIDFTIAAEDLAGSL